MNGMFFTSMDKIIPYIMEVIDSYEVKKSYSGYDKLANFFFFIEQLMQKINGIIGKIFEEKEMVQFEYGTQYEIFGTHN